MTLATAIFLWSQSVDCGSYKLYISDRRGIWEYHLDFIQKHNIEADRGIHSFWVGVNEYADMPNKEFVEKMNGYKMRQGRSEGATYLRPSNVGDLPASVDWREKGYVTEVKNQVQALES